MIPKIFKVIVLVVVLGAVIFILKSAVAIWESPAAKQGLSRLDLVPRIPMQKVRYYTDLPKSYVNAPASAGGPSSTASANNTETYPAQTYSAYNQPNYPYSNSAQSSVSPAVPSPVYYAGNQNYAQNTAAGPSQVSN